MQLNQVIDLVSHPIHNKGYEQTCKHQLDNEGVLVLKQLPHASCSCCNY